MSYEFASRDNDWLVADPSAMALIAASPMADVVSRMSWRCAWNAFSVALAHGNSAMLDDLRTLIPSLVLGAIDRHDELEHGESILHARGATLSRGLSRLTQIIDESSMASMLLAFPPHYSRLGFLEEFSESLVVAGDKGVLLAAARLGLGAMRDGYHWLFLLASSPISGGWGSEVLEAIAPGPWQIPRPHLSGGKIDNDPAIRLWSRLMLSAEVASHAIDTAGSDIVSESRSIWWVKPSWASASSVEEAALRERHADFLTMMWQRGFLTHERISSFQKLSAAANHPETASLLESLAIGSAAGLPPHANDHEAPSKRARL